MDRDVQDGPRSDADRDQRRADESAEQREALRRLACVPVSAAFLVCRQPYADARPALSSRPVHLVERARRLLRRSFPAPRRLASELTHREFEVLRLLAFGMCQDEIATHLQISPNTVGAHIEHILLKLGVQSRAQAVAVAYRDNLVEVERAKPITTVPRAENN